MADRLDLKKDIQFETTVKSAHFDEATQRWQVTTDKGEVIDTQFLVTCCGMLSARTSPSRDRRRFKGKLFHTARWPKGTDRILPASASALVGNGARPGSR